MYPSDLRNTNLSDLKIKHNSQIICNEIEEMHLGYHNSTDENAIEHINELLLFNPYFVFTRRILS